MEDDPPSLSTSVAEAMFDRFLRWNCETLESPFQGGVLSCWNWEGTVGPLDAGDAVPNCCCENGWNYEHPHIGCNKNKNFNFFCAKTRMRISE